MSQDANRPKTPLKRWGWSMAALACVAVAYLGWQHFNPGSGAAPQRHAGQQSGPPAPVHAAVVATKPFPVVLNGLGTVQATNTVTVRSRVDGQIEKVAFEEGQMVKEGDLLVQIDPAPFQATLNQATAKLAQDQASLLNAKQDLDRTAVLSKQGNATQQLLDQRTASVASLTAQVQADQAAIDSAKVQLAYTTIRSPLAGRAGFRLVDAGNIVHANDQNGMLTITQLQPISVVFTASEQDLPAINDALKSGPLKVTAYTIRREEATRRGHAEARRQPGRPSERHHPSEGELRQSRQCALAGPVRDHAAARQDIARRGGGARHGRAARTQRPLRLRRHARTPRPSCATSRSSQIEGGLALVDQGPHAGERIVTSGHYRVQPGGLVEVLDDQERTARPPTSEKVD